MEGERLRRSQGSCGGSHISLATLRAARTATPRYRLASGCSRGGGVRETVTSYAMATSVRVKRVEVRLGKVHDSPRMGERMLHLLIRDARPEDRDAICDVTLAAYEEYAAQMPPLYWEAYRLNILATLDQVGPAEQIVAEREGTVIGTVLLYPPRSFSPPGDEASLEMLWPEVRLLAVAPAGRGGGVGAALMNECVRRARRLGTSALSLHTTDMMRTAMRMYARMGFVRAPELDFQPLPDVTVKGYSLDFDAT